jgi:FAD:protein FMN transferase
VTARFDQADFEALGTSCHLFGVDVGPDRLEWGRGWVAAMHARFTRFDEGSELSRFNACAGRWAAVSPELEAMLRAALDAHRATGGLVHAGVLPAVLATGYTRTLRLGPTAATAGPPPPAPLPDLLEVATGRARLREGAGIDLGGIAKGWLADRLASELGENCLVNLGGDLFARGAGPDGQGWPVGVGGSTVLLRDQGAATSGTRRRRWGAEVHHLIDPRTGRPAVSDLSEVSVVAPSALEAEVNAKAALLLGAAGATAYLATNALAWSLVDANAPLRGRWSVRTGGGD